MVGAVAGLLAHTANSENPPPPERIADEVMRLTLGVCMTPVPSDEVGNR